ncbi:MAG: YitT family protein [Bacteroidales bacterium]|nr:YitT family protein [Bacteroidales bacterium]
MEIQAKRKLWKIIGEYAVMILGVALYCASWECFMIPNDLSSGGLTGLCTVIQYATGGRLKVSFLYAAINVFLLLLAFAVMGAKFGFKTICCIALASLFFHLFEMVPQLHSVEGRFLFVPEKWMIPAIGGLLEGGGLGLIFRTGGSTGGSDILALIVNKFWPVTPGRFFLISDIIIVLSLLLLPGRAFADLVYGFIMIIISATILDAVLVGGRSSVQMMIFSEKSKEIADYIIRQMDRGVTALHAMGWYTQQEKDVLLVVVQQKEVFEITRMVKNLDRKAFMSISPASNVYGEGFEEIKSGLEKKKNA